VTLNGLGVREGVLVALLAVAGVPTARGAAVALLTLTVSTGFSLLGGLIYPFYRATHRTEEPQTPPGPNLHEARQERLS
jgi:uncharacterized membrane protein YbhN (UPF0104 family)